MELVRDWRSFRETFRPRVGRVRVLDESSPVYIVAKEGKIVEALAPGEDLHEWIGGDVSEAAAHFSHREFYQIEHSDIDSEIFRVAEKDFYFDQRASLRDMAALKGKNVRLTAKRRFKGADLRQMCGQEHFFLNAMNTWWGKTFPSACGFLFRFDDNAKRDFFMVVRDGKLEQFRKPNLRTVELERPGDTDRLIRHLAEKYGVPVQAFFFKYADWSEWSRVNDPWKSISVAIRNGRARLYPDKKRLRSMIYARGYLGI